MMLQKTLKLHRSILPKVSIIALFLSLLAIIIVMKSQTVTYTLDEYNHCTWRNGEVELSTAVNGPTRVVRIQKSQEKAYLESAAKDGKCLYPGTEYR